MPWRALCTPWPSAGAQTAREPGSTRVASVTQAPWHLGPLWVAGRPGGLLHSLLQGRGPGPGGCGCPPDGEESPQLRAYSGRPTWPGAGLCPALHFPLPPPPWEREGGEAASCAGWSTGGCGVLLCHGPLPWALGPRGAGRTRHLQQESPGRKLHSPRDGSNDTRSGDPPPAGRGRAGLRLAQRAHFLWPPPSLSAVVSPLPSRKLRVQLSWIPLSLFTAARPTCKRLCPVHTCERDGTHPHAGIRVRLDVCARPR